MLRIYTSVAPCPYLSPTTHHTAIFPCMSPLLSLQGSDRGSIWSCSAALQFSRSVVSNSLQPHESQHSRPLCPSPTPGLHSDSRPSSLWCHPAISSSVVPFSSCPSSLPASESFLMSQPFAWSGQSTGASGLSSVLPMTIQDWFPLGLTGWISLQSKGISRVSSNTTVQKHQFFGALSHSYMTTGKTIALTRWTFVGKVIFLLLNMLSRLVIAFLSRSKCLLISWLQSSSTVILEPQNIKSVTVSLVSPIYLPWSDGTRWHDLSFLTVEF